ncbi:MULTISPECIES: PerC family transcriptional regulator [Symbiopectobacterium]|uniref:PerC family transcriptional regulator n=1 Tax=Symbiopectobacterium TaxID=801 RepID=UPI001A197CC6|nr:MULTISPECIES: PerC family transcriptional regulator [Symbiopectobacterium]MBG6248373.1 PerC family transcriptional regulator [Candidatus Symbiopectobacterium sp. PLON1]MBT9430284.1 PerC family transcriptional regulator [Candidatus Symbiopectobacterium endolongispinus]
MITDDIALAEQLERKHLWRRAAHVWLTVLDQTQGVRARAEAVHCRKKCQISANGLRSQYSGIRVITAAGGVLND